MDINKKAEIGFKKSINKGFTGEGKRYHLEPDSLKIISPDQIKMQLGDIPESILTPVLEHYYKIDGSDDGLTKTSESVLYYSEITANLVLGTTTFKIDTNLSLIPPYTHNGFYVMLIKKPNTITVQYGEYGMYIDYEAGLISFDEIPTDVTDTLNVECWLYVGYELLSDTPKESELPSAIKIQLTTETLPSGLSWDDEKFTYTHGLNLQHDPIYIIKDNNTILNATIETLADSVRIYVDDVLMDDDNVYLFINNIITGNRTTQI